MDANTFSADEIISFWFSEPVSKLWFNSTPTFDQQLCDNYGALYQSAKKGTLDHWTTSAKSALALVIVLDQFPLNMFRGKPESFATEAKAREIAQRAIAHHYHQQLPKTQIAFLLLPFMHSESMTDQDYSVKLFAEVGLHENLKYAKHHREIVRRFGRFPHRNVILGRESTPEEIEYLNSPEGFQG